MRIWPTKRGWKRFGLGLSILLAIGLIVNGVFAWRAQWRLENRLAAIRAAGDPASIAELAPAPIPDSENAAAILARVRPRLKEFGNAYGDFYKSPLGKEYEAQEDRNEPPTSEQIAAIRTILADYADVEEAIGKAAVCERYASRLDFSLEHRAFLEQMLEYIQESRTAARLLAWRNKVLQVDGQHETAVRNGIAALRLARLHTNEPTLVAYLVAIAMRSIASEQMYDSLSAGVVSPELHAALDQELARHDDPQQLTRVLKTERAVSAGWSEGQLGLPGGWLPPRMFRWPMKSMQIGVLDEMGDALRLADQPWYAVKQVFGDGKSSAKPTGHGIMADLLVPAIRAAFLAHARSLAVSRALRIDNALREFAEQNGREAAGLADLNLPRAATIDPFSGEPLKLKHTEDGWIVYTVMENGVDDGGDFKGLKDYGAAPRKWRATE